MSLLLTTIGALIVGVVIKWLISAKDQYLDIVAEDQKND